MPRKGLYLIFLSSNILKIKDTPMLQIKTNYWMILNCYNFRKFNRSLCGVLLGIRKVLLHTILYVCVWGLCNTLCAYYVCVCVCNPACHMTRGSDAFYIIARGRRERGRVGRGKSWFSIKNFKFLCTFHLNKVSPTFSFISFLTEKNI